MSYPVDGAPGIWCDSFVGKAFLINVPLALWIAARVYNLRLPPSTVRTPSGNRSLECPQLIRRADGDLETIELENQATEIHPRDIQTARQSDFQGGFQTRNAAIGPPVEHRALDEDRGGGRFSLRRRRRAHEYRFAVRPALRARTARDPS